jgi:hypothetical protein
VNRIISTSLLFEGIVPPVYQGVAPVGVLDVSLWFLGLVAVYIADYPPHVLDIVVGVVGFFLFEDLDDLAARLVAL